ncbi:hypothetical protein D3C87_75860 [compost metagenome]
MMITTTIESLHDNSLMMQLYEIMNSLVVMDELTQSSEKATRIDVWRDTHGCMLSYVLKEEFLHSPFYVVRSFYRHDTEKIAIQFLEQDFKVVAEKDLKDYEFTSLCWHSPGKRHVRFFVELEKLQEFLFELVK